MVLSLTVTYGIFTTDFSQSFTEGPEIMELWNGGFVWHELVFPNLPIFQSFVSVAFGVPPW